jgi:hypothetical protein
VLLLVLRHRAATGAGIVLCRALVGHGPSLIYEHGLVFIGIREGVPGGGGLALARVSFGPVESAATGPTATESTTAESTTTEITAVGQGTPSPSRLGAKLFLLLC